MPCNKTDINTKSIEYKAGYSAGYKAGINIVKKQNVQSRKAKWIMKKDGWYCSNCKTKNEQAHENYCCKCGYKMSGEAGYEDN